MIFSDIVNIINEEATKRALPLLFGESESINEQVNAVSGMFLTFDVPNGTMNRVPPAHRRYDVVLQVLDESFHMRDIIREIDTLQRTDLVINQILARFVCYSDVDAIRVEKLQGIYDTIKSGWRVRFTVSDEYLNYG